MTILQKGSLIILGITLVVGAITVRYINVRNSPLRPPVVYDANPVVVERGNHAYVRINIEGEATDNVDKILEIKDWFEGQHQNFTAFNWRLDASHATEGRLAIIYGAWVDYEPKPSKIVQ